MPLKLRAPRPGKTPVYTIRGTYLGVYVEQSTGTGRREIAEQLLRKKRDEIERGAVARPGEPNFADAAINYMTAGGERRFLAPLIQHFGTTALSAVNQAAIDHAAGVLYPAADAPTRNRQVYTPISAVLKRAGIESKVKRPIGWRGRRLTSWLTQEQAFAVFGAVAEIDAPADTRAELAVLLRLLCYTGMRLGDALGLQCRNVNIKDRTALLPITKNGKPRMVYLPKVAVDALRGLPRGLDRDARVFRFHNGGRLRDLLAMTMKGARVTLPRRVAFHVFCHTYGTWMRQYGGLDTYDLLDTGRWAEAESANRYAHVVVGENARRADLLPVEPKRRKAQ
jgi:integrase